VKFVKEIHLQSPAPNSAEDDNTERDVSLEPTLARHPDFYVAPAEQEYSFAGFVHEVFAMPFGKAGIRS
jgi:hypothetical protein